MTEEILSNDSMNLVDCTITKLTDALRACRNEFLHKNMDENNTYLQNLTKDLASKSIEDDVKENNNEMTKKMHLQPTICNKIFI